MELVQLKLIKDRPKLQLEEEENAQEGAVYEKETINIQLCHALDPFWRRAILKWRYPWAQPFYSRNWAGHGHHQLLSDFEQRGGRAR